MRVILDLLLRDFDVDDRVELGDFPAWWDEITVLE
jgi:hypothetical protein